MRISAFAADTEMAPAASSKLSPEDRPGSELGRVGHGRQLVQPRRLRARRRQAIDEAGEGLERLVGPRVQEEDGMSVARKDAVHRGLDDGLRRAVRLPVVGEDVPADLAVPEPPQDLADPGILPSGPERTPEPRPGI